MSKLNKSSKNFFKIIATMSVLLSSGLSSADEAANTQLLEEMDKIVNGIVNDGSRSSFKTSQKNRQGLEVLFNTSWEFSYGIDDMLFTSKMDLSDNAESFDGIKQVEGTFSITVNGVADGLVFCTFEPGFIDALGVDYLCVIGDGENSPMFTIGFRISGDSMTDGIIGFGNTPEMVIEDLSLKRPITGSRIGGPGSGTSEIPTKTSEASYNDVTNELVVPVVNYKGAKYSVILQDTGNLVFILKDAVPTK